MMPCHSAVSHDLINPASMKQSLISSARRLHDNSANMFEQGHGKLDLLRAYQTLSNYKPHVSLSPAYLDMTECQYMWPYCSQPLYYGARPLIVNVSALPLISLVNLLLLLGYHPQWYGCEWLDKREGMLPWLLLCSSYFIPHSQFGNRTCSIMGICLRWVCICDHVISSSSVQVSFSYPSRLWPWSGYITIMVGVSHQASIVEGTAEGHVSLTVASRLVSN